MRKGSLLGIAVAAALCFCVPQSVAWAQEMGTVTGTETQESTAEDFEYEILDDDTVEITGYKGSDTEVVIPAMIEGKAVKSIGDGAFEDCSNLIKIVIPSGVTSIESSAFYRCRSLTEITIPVGVTEISEYTFGSCESLARITIPDGVTRISESAFSNCKNLNEVTIPPSTTWIDYDVFDGCSGLVSIKVDSENTAYDSRDNCNAIIETKSNKLLRGCKNTVIPDNVISIERKAFYGCNNLIQITIPSNVTSIGSNVFGACESLTSIKVDSGNTVYDSRDDCNAIIKTESNMLWSGCKNTVIPDTVTGIADDAFFRCSNLTQITIPSSVTSIGWGAFEGCSNLAQITIPSSVTNIGDYTFAGCSNLAQITISSSVTNIGDAVFYNCSSLTQITIPSSVTTIGGEAFSGCSNLTEITIPSSVTKIYYDTFKGCSGLVSIKVDLENTIYDSRDNCNAIVETESNKLMRGCKNTVIPNSIASIGGEAFSGCSNLTEITIPASVTRVGYDTFDGCSGLASIKVDTENTVYDSRDNCNAIVETESNELVRGCKNTVIPSSVTSIGYGAFSGCGNLGEITIPASVTDIGSYAFDGCGEQLVLSVHAGSYAETYAKENGLQYKIISGGSSSGDNNKPTTGDGSGSGSTDKGDGSQTGNGGSTGNNGSGTGNGSQTGGNSTGNGSQGSGNPTDNGTSTGDKGSSDKMAATCKLTLSKTSYTYSGKTRKPTVKVKNSEGKTLKSGTDYTVSYPKGMKNVGVYTVAVKLKGSYSGTLKADFKVIPKSTTISKLTATKKGFQVKWKKQTSQTTGYEVAYSTSKKFPKKDTKTLKAGKSKTTSGKATKLKAKKKYYVRIRTYKTVKVNKKSTKVYSSWSKVKTVTTKK